MTDWTSDERTVWWAGWSAGLEIRCTGLIFSSVTYLFGHGKVLNSRLQFQNLLSPSKIMNVNVFCRLQSSTQLLNIPSSNKLTIQQQCFSNHTQLSSSPCTGYSHLLQHEDFCVILKKSEFVTPNSCLPMTLEYLGSFLVIWEKTGKQEILFAFLCTCDIWLCSVKVLVLV